jgi:hypothetical protein
MIHARLSQGRARHALDERVLRVLHHRYPTARLDRQQPHRPIAQRAREHHADGTRAIGA